MKLRIARKVLANIGWYSENNQRRIDTFRCAQRRISKALWRNNVHRFGAQGDGFTDDVAAVQAALAAPTKIRGAKFPPGTYLFASTLRIDVARKDTFLFGPVIGATIIRAQCFTPDNHGPLICIGKGGKVVSFSKLHLVNAPDCTAFECNSNHPQEVN